FVTSMIAQARGDQPPMLTPIADGVSDIRLFRVSASSGINNILLAPAALPGPAAPPPGAGSFDHWINGVGGDWATAANWGNGVPTANFAADIDAAGTYTVTISSADTTYGLLINAAGAAVSDNTGGSLSITGSGGPSNPNGALTISAGRFALAGGNLSGGS